MKKREIYEIATKIVGIYFAVLTIFQVRDFTIFISFGGSYSTILAFLGSVLVSVIVIYILLFQTKFVLSFMMKNSDNEQVKFFIKRNDLYEIVLGISGILLIIFAIFNMVFEIKNYFELQKHFFAEFNYVTFLLPITKGILGFLLVKFSKQITNYISKQ